MLNALDLSILEILEVIDKSTRDQVRFLIAEIHEKAVPIPQEIKREVYENANKRCECCGRLLKMEHGDFHHTESKNTKLRTSTIQFLCPTDHRIYGHICKGGQIRTQKVSKQQSPYWKRKVC